MTVTTFFESIVLGLVISWAALHAGINLYSAMEYIVSGMPGALTAWTHIGLTVAIIAYVVFENRHG